MGWRGDYDALLRPREVPDRLLPGAQRSRERIWRRWNARSHSHLDLLRVAHRALRSRVHAGLDGEIRWWNQTGARCVEDRRAKSARARPRRDAYRGSTGVVSSCQISTSYPSRSRKKTYGSPGQNSPRSRTVPPARSTAVTAASMSAGSTRRNPKCAMEPDERERRLVFWNTMTSRLPGVCAWIKPSGDLRHLRWPSIRVEEPQRSKIQLADTSLDL